MRLGEAGDSDVRRPLRRAEDRLRGCDRHAGRRPDCTDVLTQLAAVAHALHRAVYAMLADGLEQCLSAPADGERTKSVARLKKLFPAVGWPRHTTPAPARPARRERTS